MDILKEKRIILTGASSGMGRELAARLVRERGCRVLGVGRSEEKLAELAGELGEGFAWAAFDVADRQAWKTLAARLEAEDFRPDALYNNAGVMPRVDSFLSAAGDFDKNLRPVFETDFIAALYGMDALMPLLLKSPSPVIINTASASAYMGVPGMAAYCASKAALKTFCDCVSRELRGSVRMVTVCPGFVKTALFREQPGGLGGLAGKFCMPADVAARRILLRISRGRRHITVGADGWLFRVGHGLFGGAAADVMAWLLRVSRIELFAGAFSERGGGRP